ncbi:DNA-binding response regulator [Brumimicrobium salinarum]|uniref:DNA-binding response regulator n=1 Tax=Brumimicrobium salinarum TaxID=2058658 RepID=A0A2I0QZV5_9FLAO|nr:response regulator transcription factor [Brumimicrobium salinarum]PKR79881.1 DNA-binding response regulator [Brumimicrobium salinarum]
MTPKILLVEDDTSLGFVISDQLKMEGYEVTLASDGMDGFKRFNEEDYHLCIFDVMMPKKDGFSLAEDVRKINKQVPILFLTAKSMTEDKVKGFNVGGDDYLTKPFSSAELKVRVKALLKRVDIQTEADEQSEMHFGDFIYDILNYTLKGPDFEKKLTKKEAHILKMLGKFENQVVPRELVLNAVWGKDDYFVGRSLDVFITKLRKYFTSDPRVIIENIHGIGFKLYVKENLN